MKREAGAEFHKYCSGTAVARKYAKIEKQEQTLFNDLRQ